MKECRRLSLTSFLIMPVQRLPRYRLLLQDIFKETANGTAAKSSIKVALKAVMDVTSKISSEKSDENIDPDQILSLEMQIIKNLKKIFLLISGYAFQKYGQELDKNQQVLIGLSNIMIEVYFSESAILRTIKNNKKGADMKYQIDMTRIYVFEATEIVIKSSKELIANISKGDEQLNLMKSVHRLCRYDQIPDIISLKNRVADRVIAENQYCF